MFISPIDMGARGFTWFYMVFYMVLHDVLRMILHGFTKHFGNYTNLQWDRKDI